MRVYGLFTFIPSTYVCIALNFRVGRIIKNTCSFIFELHVIGLKIANVYINVFMYLELDCVQIEIVTQPHAKMTQIFSSTYVVTNT